MNKMRLSRRHGYDLWEGRMPEYNMVLCPQYIAHTPLCRISFSQNKPLIMAVQCVESTRGQSGNVQSPVYIFLPHIRVAGNWSVISLYSAVSSSPPWYLWSNYKKFRLHVCEKSKPTGNFKSGRTSTQSQRPLKRHFWYHDNMFHSKQNNPFLALCSLTDWLYEWIDESIV